MDLREETQQKISATYEELKAVMLLVRSYCLVWSKPNLPWLRCGEKAHPLFLISLTDLYSHNAVIPLGTSSQHNLLEVAVVNLTLGVGY